MRQALFSYLVFTVATKCKVGHRDHTSYLTGQEHEYHSRYRHQGPAQAHTVMEPMGHLSRHKNSRTQDNSQTTEVAGVSWDVETIG